MKTAISFLAFSLMTSGCAPAVGPSRDDLANALQTPASNVRALRCHDIVEEPTEFGCRYRRQDATGAWVDQNVAVAIDGSTWVIIDGPHSPVRP